MRSVADDPHTGKAPVRRQLSGRHTHRGARCQNLFHHPTGINPSTTAAPRAWGPGSPTACRNLGPTHYDRRVYSSLRRAPGRGRGPPKEAVALIKRIRHPPEDTPPNRCRGHPECAIEAFPPEAGFASRSSRYCSRAAVFSVGEAAQLVRIVLIAPHRPASRGFSAAPSLFAGSCESARVEE